MGKVLRVGVTGGSGCGKTTVARWFAGLGAVVIDADRIARRLLRPGLPAFRETVEAFGSGILAPDGRIDRARLAAMVFADAARRRRLESILHPRIRRAEARRVRAAARGRGARIVVTDAALLVETGTFRSYDFLVVVHCRRETQIRRLREGAGLARADALMRLRAQWPTATKLRFADFAVDTERRPAETRRTVARIFARLQRRLRSSRAIAAKRLPSTRRAP